MKILIAEDDSTNCFLLETYLSTYGECTVVENGREAVKAFRAELEAGKPFDLICMDVVMPHMNGHDAVRAIRVLERNRGNRDAVRAKIIMTTALSDRGNVIMSAREECDAYVVKPIDTVKLRTHLEAFGLLG